MVDDSIDRGLTGRRSDDRIREFVAIGTVFVSTVLRWILVQYAQLRELTVSSIVNSRITMVLDYISSYIHPDTVKVFSAKMVTRTR